MVSLHSFAIFLLFLVESQSIPLTDNCHDEEGNPMYCSPPAQSNIASGVVPVASSTCGVDGPEQVCAIGCIHSCDTCTSTNSHPASFMTDGLADTYWRSQTYSSIQEESVTVNISLGKTHYIQKISIVFESPRPESFAILASTDGGVSYTPVQYFSQSCQETYNIPQDSSNSNGVSCTSEGSGRAPLTGGVATFSSDPLGSLIASDIMLSLDELSTLGNEATWSSDGLSSYSYAISSLMIEGGCFCNGHADTCNVDQQGVPYCVCQHNTTGSDCQSCLASHNDSPWQALEQDRTNDDVEYFCKACDCNGRSDECNFELSTYLSSGNRSGGVCSDCQGNTTGNNCRKCAEGFYPINSNIEELVCEECVCDPRGIIGGDGTCPTAVSIYAASGSTCPCKANVNGTTCNTCVPGFHSLNASDNEGCQVCQCSVEGSLSAVCDELTGQCVCKLGYYGRTCQQCGCSASGTVDPLVCDTSGVCECATGAEGDKCDVCSLGYYYSNTDDAGCIACDCHAFGSINSSCDVLTGQCYCKTGFSSSDCSVCPDGFHDIDSTNGCTSCPECYDSVMDEFTITERLLDELIVQTNISLSSSILHPDLINSVEETRTSLARLLELLNNLTQREILLRIAVNETSANLSVKQDTLSGYSVLVRQALSNSMTALTFANSSRNQVNGLFEVFNFSRSVLNELRDNLTVANQLLENILRLRRDLINIASQSDSLSREQSTLVSVLQLQASALLDNTTDVLASICEALENENSTLVNLTSIQNYTLPELDDLLMKAQVSLQDAISNSSTVLSNSIRVFDEIRDIVIPNYGSQELLNRSRASVKEAMDNFDSTRSLSSQTEELRNLFGIINNITQSLSARIQFLNSTAVDLIERATVALRVANTSVESAEIVINEINSLSVELERRLNEYLEFLSRYNDLVKIVERAENISESARMESTNQFIEIQRIAIATSSINAVLQASLENLALAIEILQNANETVSNTLIRAQAIDLTLQDLPEQFDSANRSLQVLEERAEGDHIAINRAESVTNATVLRADTLNSDLQTVDRLLDKLQEDINNITLIPEARYLSLKNDIDALEAVIIQTDRTIESVASEVSTLQAQSDVLESKYTELRRHRELLNNIRSNIQNLDCERDVIV